MIETAQVVLSPWIKGEPITRRCSLCGQALLAPEDGNPNLAFNDHARGSPQRGTHKLALARLDEAKGACKRLAFFRSAGVRRGAFERGEA